jgi:two-component system, NarL family, sensor kinase
MKISFYVIISHSLENALTLEEKNHLYRILQECINNTLKHTNDKAIKVSLYKEDKQIVFEYKDNGTVSNDNSRLNKTKGIGLQTIEERTEKIKGKQVYELDAQKR